MSLHKTEIRLVAVVEKDRFHNFVTKVFLARVHYYEDKLVKYEDFWQVGSKLDFELPHLGYEVPNKFNEFFASKLEELRNSINSAIDERIEATKLPILYYPTDFYLGF